MEAIWVNADFDRAQLAIRNTKGGMGCTEFGIKDILDPMKPSAMSVVNYTPTGVTNGDDKDTVFVGFEGFTDQNGEIS
jgi:hypothetical protein